MRLPLLTALLVLATGCQSPGQPGPGGAPAAVAIARVQGSTERSPIEGQPVTVEGVVVADLGRGFGGVFIQSLQDDGDPATSEGLFLALGGQPAVALAVGDHVRATGTVKEIGQGSGTLTGLVEVEASVLARGLPVVPRAISEPPVPDGWEAYEGMLLRIEAPMTVAGNDGLMRFGELLISFAGRRFAPTERAAPGLEADALAQENFHQMLRLDDGLSAQNPGEPWFLPQPLSHENPLRTGSVIGAATGVIDQRFGSHRLQLTAPLEAITQAPRPAAPTVPGDRRIVGLNVLNLFNGDGRGGGFPTERGAATAADHARQQAKLVATVQALDPDLLALMELENDGFGPDSALAQFVAALNAAGPHRDWRYVDAGEGPGEGSIRVGLAYRSTRFQTVGAPVTLLAPPFNRASRAPLAQAFRAGRGPVFVVVNNHFKSKGGCRPDTPGGDADQGDGQACFNATRVASAEALHDWLATDPTGTRPAGQLVVGDLNAHAQEDPLRALYARGWRDAFEVAGADQPYSYVWAGLSARLDHALVDAGLAARLRGAAEWHSNADESERFSYAGDPGTGPWRASDHDPVLLGLDLAR